jgi:hypothetical protein
MNEEQKTTAIFAVLGFASGFFSTYIHDLWVALVVPSIAYLAVVALCVRAVRRKRRSYLTNSFVSFFLVWLVVWIFLFNTVVV